MNWGPVEIARLRELAAGDDRPSAADIAKRFRGHSRNSIIGACHRNGIKLPNAFDPDNPRQKQNRRKHNRKKPKSWEPKPMPDPIQLVFADVVPLNIDLLDLDKGQCRYPYGDGPFLFCGHPAQAESKYCPAHHRLTHTKATEISEAERARRRQQGRENFRSVKVA
jgi:GcrA cell cycle regulator